MRVSDDGCVELPGLVDHHTHLLKQASGVPFAWQPAGTVRQFHEQVAASGSTPMDVPEPDADEPLVALAGRLRRALAEAARTGLTEVTEMGMRSWWYLDALDRAAAEQPLPARVRIYLASGLAGQSSLAELRARRDGTAPWVRLDGVKFYSDGWLVPRTCALCAPFDHEGHDGVLFLDAAALARRIEPLAADGWRIATHAIGDRAAETVLDAYELAWGGDRRAIAAAAPRIEHGAVLSADLAARIAALGVAVCLQPSFAVTDAPQIPAALGADRIGTAYPWALLAEAGVTLLAGTDFPIEVIHPLVGLARLVRGRSDRDGFADTNTAPPHSRLPADVALAIGSDERAGRTRLTADPRAVASEDIDAIEVIGTAPVPFADRRPNPGGLALGLRPSPA